MSTNDGKPKRHNTGSRRQATETLLVQAFMFGATREAAAKHAKVSLNAVKRHLADPKFQEALAEAKQEVIDQTVNQIVTHASAAVRKLRQLLDSSNEAIALGAARDL